MFKPEYRSIVAWFGLTDDDYLWDCERRVITDTALYMQAVFEGALDVLAGRIRSGQLDPPGCPLP